MISLLCVYCNGSPWSHCCVFTAMATRRSALSNCAHKVVGCPVMEAIFPWHLSLSLSSSSSLSLSSFSLFFIIFFFFLSLRHLLSHCLLSLSIALSVFLFTLSDSLPLFPPVSLSSSIYVSLLYHHFSPSLAPCFWLCLSLPQLIARPVSFSLKQIWRKLISPKIHISFWNGSGQLTFRVHQFRQSS